MFSYDRVLSFEGETGPYIQYTHARCNSVIKKYQGDFENVNYDLLTTPEELELIKQIEIFPEVIMDAARKNEPCFISRYILNLCSLYNKFYFEKRIISDDAEATKARVLLTKVTKDIIKKGLYLIGMKAPESM